MVRYKREDFKKKFTSAYNALKSMRMSLKLYVDAKEDEYKQIYLNSVIFTFNDLTEFFICICEDYAVKNNIIISPEKGYLIIESTKGFLNDNEIRLLQQMVRTRNRVTHDYYDRELEVKNVIKVAISYEKKLVEIIRKFEEELIEK